MERAADPVSSALEATIDRFRRLVRGVGARHGLSEADLDEVLQEVRVRLWRACGTSEQIERVGTSYVYRTAVSAALDLLRRRRARAADQTEPVHDRRDDLPHEDRGPLHRLEGEELTARILDAVDLLPASRRAVVRMYLSGYEREEIAELLGWTEAKTRNLLYRGLADLRKRLTEWGITLEGSE